MHLTLNEAKEKFEIIQMCLPTQHTDFTIGGTSENPFLIASLLKSSVTNGVVIDLELARKDWDNIVSAIRAYRRTFIITSRRGPKVVLSPGSDNSVLKYLPMEDK